jgi:hypothetical protein
LPQTDSLYVGYGKWCRAQARDDPDAIGDTGYNLAVAELRANAPHKALADARATGIELERRGIKPFPALLLAEATALYRTGAAAEADRAARRIQQSEDANAVARATFLRGLITDDGGDEAGLATAADALTAAKTSPFEVDSAELSSRLALRRGDPPLAREQAAHAAGLRQATLDYRGLARALAIEGVAVERAGDKIAAADLFLRAGRSAAAQGDKTSAVIGSTARCPSPLAAPSVVMPQTYCVASIRSTADRALLGG